MKPQTTEDLLAEVLDTLVEISEFLEKQEDVMDDPMGYGEPMANPAMRLRSRLESNEWETGLIDKVRTAWKQTAQS